MDTISVKLVFERKDLTMEEMGYIENYIKGIKSTYGYNYCTKSKIEKDGITVRISYPKYFFSSNAYLITTSDECKKVNLAFCRAIVENFPYQVSSIKLVRVDVPYTYHMSGEDYFHNYKNIFKIFAMVFQSKNTEACPKTINELLSENIETLIYAKDSDYSSSNSKIQIYNQYKNINNKSKEIEFKKTEKQFPDLSRRIRIEVAKRINSRVFTVEQFANYDIYEEFYPKYKRHILTNFLDMNQIDHIYEDLARLLADKLQIARQDPKFNYEVFILNSPKLLQDYRIVRRALELVIDNKKTLETAITRVRKILKVYEKNHEIIIMDTYKHIENMYNKFKK